MQPGCFGFATNFDARAERCKNCPANVECANQVVDTLKTLKSEGVGVDDLTRRVQVFYDRNKIKKSAGETGATVKFKLTMEQQSSIAKLPKNVGLLVKSIAKKGMDISASIERGENPFQQQRPEFMQPICDVLLSKSLVERGDFEDSLRESKPHWSETTVRNHASIARRALLELKVIKELPDRKYRRAV